MNYNINVVGRYNTTHVPPLSLIHTSLSFMFGIFQAYMARVKLDIATAELLRQRRLLIAQRRTPKSAVPKKKIYIPHLLHTGIGLVQLLSAKYVNFKNPRTY